MADLSIKIAGRNRWSASDLACHFALFLAVVVGLYFAARSAYLGATLVRSMPFFDHWISVVLDYFRWVDGKYSVQALFDQHNEHRILTTRLVLLADAIFFDMSGKLPIFVIYASLAGIATTITILATRGAAIIERFALLSILLGLMWSICQHINLSWQFQVQFPITHLLAILTLSLMVIPGRPFVAAAIVCDFLAVFSLGSGILLLIPICVLAAFLWRREVAWIIAAHITFTAAYFISFRFFQQELPTGPAQFLNRFAKFIGSPFIDYPDFAIYGIIGMAMFAICVGALFYERLAFARLSSARVVLLAIALFSVLEGVTVASLRGDVSGRYSTAALVFWACLLAFGWSFARSLKSFSANLLRLAVILLAIFCLTSANRPGYEFAWRTHVAFLDEAVTAIRNGENRPDLLTRLTPEPWLPEAIKRLEELHKGPFR